ncbi:MAG: right-handed parallel beta-helix repeat-containing protein [Phycisphaerae bacterium]
MPSPALRSLKPPVLLPDGREFKTWQQPMTFSRTYHVDGSSAGASDENPGTKARPFKTISRAAEVLRPGERVLVAAGVYRERVRPARGGTGPGAMIGYQASGKVVIKGSRVLKARWTRSTRKPAGESDDIWAAPLGEAIFGDYNPFRVPNITPEQFDHMPWATRWRGKKPYTLPRGLVFQNGRRLRQVHNYEDLNKDAGTYWVTPKAAKLYIRPPTGSDPNADTIEVTTQGGVFAPEKQGLGYIHVKGFIIEHAGNAFPMPQHGALSVNRGHHWLIESNTVREVNGVGIDVGIQQYWERPVPKLFGHHIVRGNTVTDCGVCGIAGLRTSSCLIEDNVLLRNALHDVEHYYETGAIKTHHNVDSLLRGNLIVGTLHGPGIWMDFTNVNSRCTRNIIIDTATIHGGIFIEASSKLNMIDHNFIWGTEGNGIYEHDCRGQLFAHNFIGGSTKAGILLRGKVTDRQVHGEPIVGGGHRAVNNVLIGNETPITAKGPASTVSGNLTEGVTATFDVKTLTLTWRAAGEVPPCERIETITHDFWNRPRPTARVWPGPFGRPSKEPAIVELRAAR